MDVMKDPSLDPDHPVHVCPLCRQSNRDAQGARQGVVLGLSFAGTARSGGWPAYTTTRFCMPCGMVVVDKLLELGYLLHPIEP